LGNVTDRESLGIGRELAMAAVLVTTRGNRHTAARALADTYSFDSCVAYGRRDGAAGRELDMAGDGTENWRLILEAARALTAAGQSPFTRVSVYEWIWRRYPRNVHDRPSLDPIFQGMVRNAPGGPASSAGTPLTRVGRGEYVLVAAAALPGSASAALGSPPRVPAPTRGRAVFLAEAGDKQGAKEYSGAAANRLLSGLDAFAAQFRAQADSAGLPSSEHAVHFCLALGLQAAWALPAGAIVFERPSHVGTRTDLWVGEPHDVSIEVKYLRSHLSGSQPARPCTMVSSSRTSTRSPRCPVGSGSSCSRQTPGTFATFSSRGSPSSR